MTAELAANMIPAVWVKTTDKRFNRAAFEGAIGGSRASFLSREDQARLERIRQGRMLFDGKHREYFLEEARTQYDFPPMVINGTAERLYQTHNVLGLISLKSGDLLFGESPIIRAEDSIQQDRIDALDDRSSLHALLIGCAIDASYEAECFLEAVVDDGEVYLCQAPADSIFPRGRLRPDGQYRAYDRYAIKQIGTETNPITLLLETRYEPGLITRRCYQLERDGKRREIDLNQWPLDDGGAPLEPVTRTGIDRPTIIWIPNLLVRQRAVSDYDGAIDLQDKLNAKESQISRVLAKHADPKLAAPATMADEQGNLPGGGAVYFYRNKDEIPSYIVWNAELESSMRDRTETLRSLLIRTETSPSLLGLKEGAAPESHKKMRLEAHNSLSKAQRKSAIWTSGVTRAIVLAQDLEQTLPGVRYDRGPIAVELRDGLAMDFDELIGGIATGRAARVISRRRAVEMQLVDPAAVDKEVAELEAEDAAATSVFGEPNEGASIFDTPPEDDGEGGSDTSSEEAA